MVPRVLGGPVPRVIRGGDRHGDGRAGRGRGRRRDEVAGRQWGDRDRRGGGRQERGPRGDRLGAQAVMSCRPVKTCVASSAEVNVYVWAGADRSGSLLPRKTVPRKFGSGLPAASTTVTVTEKVDREMASATGVEMRNPAAPARLATSSPLLSRTVTVEPPARSRRPSPLKSPAATELKPAGGRIDGSVERAVAPTRQQDRLRAAARQVEVAVAVEVAHGDVADDVAEVVGDRRREGAVTAIEQDGSRSSTSGRPPGCRGPRCRAGRRR